MQQSKLRIEDLIRFCRFVRTNLSERQINEADAASVLSHCLSAECSGCQLVITGNELNALATGHGVASQKLQRLQQGYCGRQGCNSYFYELKLQDHPSLDLDWPKQ